MNDEVTIGIISELAKSTVVGMFSKMKGAWDSSNLKIEQELINSYESYLKKSREKHSKMKTILNRRNPVDLYKFYESIDVKLEDEVISTKDVRDLLRISNKLIITGTGGIGKSTMLKHIFLNSVDNQYAVPILVELRGLNEKEDNIDVESLVSHIYDSAKALDFESEIFYFKKGLELGENLILFDGVDELKKELADSVIRSIKDFCDLYNDCKIMVTSRPSDEFIGWGNFTEVEALKMNKSQALSLINKIEFEKEIKNRFYELLESELFDKYESFASIPLLLTIMLITFENNASIPEELNDFYEKAFVALFSTHDASKSGFKRDILSNIGYDDFKNVFAHICFKSYFVGDIEFNEDKLLTYIKKAITSQRLDSRVLEEDYLRDLTNSVCMMIKDGLNYQFSHRSFQEYFAAVYTTKLDDELQKIIFKEVFRKNLAFFENKYIRMFKEMQKERFIKNALYPPLKIVVDESKSNIDIFREFYDFIMEFNNEGYLGISNRNHNHTNKILFYQMEEIFGITHKVDRKKLKLLIDKIQMSLPHDVENEENNDEEISISTIIELGLEEELFIAVGNFEKYVWELREWIKEYDEKHNSMGNELESILNFI